MTKQNWTPARVGCYWDNGPYHISTFHVVGATVGLRSGYRLTCNRELIAEAATFEEAASLAAKHEKGER